MVLEKELISAKGLKVLVTETSPKAEVEYYLDVNHALKAMNEKDFDVFIIRVSSVKDDEGIHFAQVLRQMKKYEMTSIIFLVNKDDDKIKATIPDEFYHFWILSTPLDEILEKKFKKTLLLFLAYGTSEKDKNFIVMLDSSKEKRINTEDILFVDIEDKIVTIHMISGTIYKYPHSYYSMKKMSIKLGDGFIRIFRSVIVNKQYVEEIDYEMGYLKLEGIDKRFPLGGVKFIGGIKRCFGDSKSKGGLK